MCAGVRAAGRPVSLMCRVWRSRRRFCATRPRWIYAEALYKADGATLDDLREAATTLEEVERTARRVLGSAHPLTVEIEDDLRDARAAFRARETQPSARAKW